MKLFAVLVVTTFALVSTAADENTDSLLSAEQTEALIERALAESAVEDDDCADDTLLACVGMKKQSCEALRSSVIRECTMPMARKILSSNGEISENLELEHTKCTLALGERDHNIDAKRYIKCLPEGTFERPDLIDEWLENR